MRCSGPVNRLVMLRTRGIGGPFFQNVGGGVCLRGQGNAYGQGGALAGPKAAYTYVRDGEPNFVYIRFTQPIQVSCALPHGMTVTADGVGATITATQLQDNDELLRLTVSPPIEAGDVVVWAYVEGDPACLLDGDGDGIGDQGPLTASNDIMLAGDFMLLETGGKNIFLLEDDVAQTEGVQLETAT